VTLDLYRTLLRFFKAPLQELCQNTPDQTIARRLPPGKHQEVLSPVRLTNNCCLHTRGIDASVIVRCL